LDLKQIAKLFYLLIWRKTQCIFFLLQRGSEPEKTMYIHEYKTLKKYICYGINQ